MSIPKKILLADQPEYPYPHIHIPIKGGHITVEAAASDELKQALKKMAELAYNSIDIKHNSK